MDRKAVSPVIAIVLLLMMTVAAAGAAYFWLTQMQSSVQQSAGSQIEAITKQASTRIIAQATICKGINEVNLMGYWMMDEGIGSYANDSSKYENDGTLHPGSDGSITTTAGMWTPNSKYGDYALRFDGNDSYVEVPDDDSLDFGTSRDFTISFWIKGTGLGDYKRVLSKEDGTRVAVWVKSSGRVVLAPIDAAGDKWYWFKTNPVDDGDWHHITYTVDRDGDSVVYQNGTEVDRTSTPTGNISNTANLHFGSRSDWSGAFLNASLDEFRIYDRTLSQAQVEYLNDTNKAMGRYVSITVYNAGAEEVPEGTWVANLKKDGTTVDSDSYNASKLPPEERITLHFYFDKMKPNKEYTIELEGTETSTTVSC